MNLSIQLPKGFVSNDEVIIKQVMVEGNKGQNIATQDYTDYSIKANNDIFKLLCIVVEVMNISEI